MMYRKARLHICVSLLATCGLTLLLSPLGRHTFLLFCNSKAQRLEIRSDRRLEQFSCRRGVRGTWFVLCWKLSKTCTIPALLGRYCSVPMPSLSPLWVCTVQYIIIMRCKYLHVCKLWASRSVGCFSLKRIACRFSWSALEVSFCW
jgi:hypothetical protein